jgi:hypothetical protein
MRRRTWADLQHILDDLIVVAAIVGAVALIVFVLTR